VQVRSTYRATKYCVRQVPLRRIRGAWTARYLDYCTQPTTKPSDFLYCVYGSASTSKSGNARIKMAAVFALGSNGSGQLGIGHEEDVSVPKPVLFLAGPPTTVLSVVGGGNHTLLLGGAGELYWSGDASSGACGRVPEAQRQTRPGFRSMEPGPPSISTSPVKMVAATWAASVFTRRGTLGLNNEIYTCGIGEKGELGHGPLIVRLPAPERIPNFPPAGAQVVDLAACMSHVVVVLSNGEAYGWGNGRKGQLGSPSEIVSCPRKIDGVEFRVARAVCGKDFTCLWGDPSDGSFVLLGSDKWGLRSSIPQPALNWRDVAAGWSNIYLLRADGILLSWGRNDHGQSLANQSAKFRAMAVGSEHVLALSESGDVLAWGWGEHGNCGPAAPVGTTKSQPSVIVSSRYVPEGSEIAKIGAGCATSWVAIQSRRRAESPG